MNYLKKNLETIDKINPDFSEKIKESGQYENIEFINEKNFLVKQGSKMLLAYEKDKEYQQIDKTIEKTKLFDSENTIQVGIGSGYMLHSLLKRSESKHNILLIEPIFSLIEYAFINFDFSDYIEKGKLIICTDKKEILNVLSFMENSRVVQAWQMLVENYTSFLNSEYKDMLKLTIDCINSFACAVGTVMGAGTIIAENDIKNLPYIIKHRGVNELKNLFKCKPAIVILSAPTVMKLLPQLVNENIREKIIIIAIAQMLRPLLAFGITPDFICTVDYGEVNLEHFENLWHIDDVPLVCLNRSYAPIIEKWQGAKFIVTGYCPVFENKTIVEMLNEKGQLEQGGSVGHMALGLAILMGCNPIIHIGFDCAYETGLSHLPLGDANGKINLREDGTLDWDVTDPNSTLKDANHKMGQIIFLPGYFGNPVPTNIGLASFVTAMEDIFERYPNITFINACEGGAKKKHCIQKSLKESLKLYATKKINKEKLKSFLTLKDNWRNDESEAIKRIKYEISLFNEEIECCEKAIAPLSKMAKEKKSEKIDFLLNENEIWSTKAQDIAKKNNLLQLHLYKTSRDIHSRKFRTTTIIKDGNIKSHNDFRKRIQRSRLVLTEAIKSAKRLKQIYEDVLSYIFQSQIEITFVKTNPIIDYKSWEKLLDNGNWARPLLESDYLLAHVGEDYDYDYVTSIYDKCSELKTICIEEELKKPDLTDMINYNNAIEETREIGNKKLNNKRKYKKCIKILLKAIKIMPDKIDAIWGLATCYHHLFNVQKSIHYYNILLKLQPDNLRFQFEKGQVILHKNISQGIKIIKDVMEKTELYDNFYLRLAELSFGIKKIKEAELFIDKYLKKYPYSTEGIKLQEMINDSTESN